MTQAQLAKRMGITQQNAASLETDELNGSVTLARLMRAAEELGCEVRYLLVPKQPLEDMVANQARRRAEQKLARVNQSQALEASAMTTSSLADGVADLAQELQMNRVADLWDE
jgi:predicted DNA-binding mobile mystery protein A